MLDQIEVMQFLYPKLTKEKYEQFINEMIPKNYKQVAFFENKQCLGLSGFWLGTKLWCGKYMEIDNFIIHPKHRSKGIGKQICDYLNQIAIDNKCTMIVLDAFTTNFEAHRFYYNQGFGPKGFHFVKILQEEGLT